MKSLISTLAVLFTSSLGVASSLAPLPVQVPAQPVLGTDPGVVSIFARHDLNTGDVRAFDEMTGASLPTPAALQGIRILPIDFVGRTKLMEFHPSMPRYLTDVPSASRLVLPNSWGSLYRFSRETPAGKVYGFMHIDRDGRAHAVGERLASPRAESPDPFLPLISVSPLGDSFLVATRPGHGGNAYLVQLSDGRVIDLTSRVGPLTIKRFGLGLQEDWGVVTTTRGVLRFTRDKEVDVRIDAVRVPLGPAQAWFQGDLVFSMNGDWVMTVVGTDSENSHVWAFGPETAPERISVIPQSYEGAGFLPDFRGGPFMAIADDGRLCAWIDRDDTSRELHMGRGPAFGARDSEQVTRPLYFHDTLDEIGQTAFFRPDRLTFLAGAADYIHTGMDQADVFEVRMPEDTTTLDVQNLSLSSGETEPPFVEYGTVEPDRVVWSPYEDRLLIYDGQEREALYSVDLVEGGLVQLIDRIKDLEMLIVAQQGVLFDVRRATDDGRVHEMFRVDSLIDFDVAELVRSVPVDTEFSSPALRRDGWLTFVAVDADSNTEILSKVNVGSGEFQSFALTSQSYGPAVGYTQRGSVLFSLETPGATSYMLWPFGTTQSVALEASPETGFVLPPF